jgi:hypothetical protein
MLDNIQPANSHPDKYHIPSETLTKNTSAYRLHLNVFVTHKHKINLFGGKLLKPGNPYCGLSTNQQLTDNRQPTTNRRGIKYSCDRAQQSQRPTNNMFIVWQNLAIFRVTPIGSTVEALPTKVVNRQLSVLPLVVFCSRRCLSNK